MTHTRARLALLAAAALAGCAQIIGFPDYGAGGAGGTGGTGGATTTTTTSKGTSSTTATTATTSSGAAGGDAGCMSGAACYDGPAGTEGIGACRAGTLTCGADGGACGGQEVLPTTERCDTTGVDENCDGIAACTGQLRWAAQIPGAAGASLVAAGADGTVAAVGNLVGGAAFASVEVLDPRGRPCWDAPTVLGMGTAAANGVAVIGAGPAYAPVSCPGNAPTASTVVVGQASGQLTFPGLPPKTSVGGLDAFAALVDPTGKVVWGQLFGSAAGDDAAVGVATSSDGYVYVTGSAAGALDLSCPEVPDAGAPPGAGAFVAKLRAADGACVWSELWTTSGQAQATGVAVAADGNVVVAGQFTAQLDLGSQQLAQTGANGTFVVKLTPDGTIVHTTTYQCDNAVPVRVAASPLPGAHVYLAGSVLHGLDNGPMGLLCPQLPSIQPYFLELGSDLSTLTWVCYGTNYADAGNSDILGLGVAVDGAGNAVLALGGTGTLNNPQAPFPVPLVANGLVVFKLTPTAFHTYAWQALTTPAITAAGLAVDGLGNVVVAATAGNALNLGGQIFDAGAESGFVVELAP